ncbi:MAG: hypothetical protein K6E30_05230 [Lachnospiraceae bacterium]|nr:hypothetical protein [Lachnospiraceae bacterium]
MKFRKAAAFAAALSLIVCGARMGFAANEEADPHIVAEEAGGEELRSLSDGSVLPEGGVLPAYGDSLLDFGGTEENEALLVGASTLPSSYRIKNLPPVSDQGAYSTCWTYATMNSSQINLLKAGYGSGADFSEYQLLYDVFHGETDTFIPTRSWYDSPGSYMYSTAALARNYGAGDAAVYPYNISKTLSAEEMIDDIALIDHVIWPGTWPTSQSDWKGDAWEQQTLLIKQLLKSEGAMVVSYNSHSERDTANNSYYTAWGSGSKPSPDHAITLIGWDDEKTTQAGSGAYLAMNSYGEDSIYDENGFFWVSYDDASLQDPAVFVMEEREPGIVRDPLAFSWTGTGLGLSWKTNRSAKAANVYTPDQAVCVDRIGLYLPAGVSFSVQLYKGLTDSAQPESGTAAASASGNTEYKGFFKADLSKAVEIAKGESFSLVVQITDGSARYFLAEGASKTYQTTAISEGQSFYYDGSSWLDVKGGVTVSSQTVNCGNFCIYAYGYEQLTLGDAGLDGSVGLDDLLLTARHVAGKSSLSGSALRAADYNKSGAVDHKDMEGIAALLL